jgi:diguanylate cyclase (GGDEF)-like protein/PAS domain S-box-containing protein
MIPKAPPPESAGGSEISMLIRALRESDQRLDELTSGEVDTVSDRDGPPFMLRRAQEAGRSDEAAKQVAILSALPANIALLDSQGQITSINAAWQRFAAENGLLKPGSGVGLSYLEVCDSAQGHDAGQAHQVARGIRSVLTSKAAQYAFEYRCDSPTEQRWYRLTATPLAGSPPNGAVVMHIDISEQRCGEEALRRFDAAMNVTADAILLIDRTSMCCIHVNDAACRMLNRSREELLQMHPVESSAASKADWEQTYEKLITGDLNAKHEEMSVPGPDGPPTWFEVRRDVHSIESRSTIVVVARDITARKHAEKRIKQLNRLYAVLSGINTLIVRVRDRDELFRQVCRIAVEAGAFKMAWVGVIDPQTQEGRCVAACGMDETYLQRIILTARPGTPASDRPACRALRLARPVICNNIETDASMAAFRADLLKYGMKAIGCFPLGVAGRPEAVLALLSGGPDIFDAEEIRLLEELAGDISFALDHIAKEEKLNYLAYYDELTGLANRSLLLERVAPFIRSAAADKQGLAIFLLDLERFKNINYSLGRAAGDALLRQVAEWLTSQSGDPSLVARVGGDHFAVVVPHIAHHGDAARRLEKTMQSLLEHPFQIGGAELRIAARVGVAISPHDGTDADTLLKNAEAALKKTKAGGARYLFYSHKMTESVAYNLMLENQLRRALENGELVLHYQPKVSLASGEVIGAEALIRWNNPRGGLMPPDQFIPILEESGLIFEVGRWAITKAIQDYLSSCDAGFTPVRIAVNVSPVQLSHRDFIADLSQAIQGDRRARDALELELTESVVMEDVKHSIASLQSIRAMGLTVAIDDFGTGFSSLSYLSKLPLDALKIGRSFVSDMTLSSDGLALVSAIIGLAHSLNLKVVAEGAETAAQLGLLRDMNCDDYQGYIFSKPVPYGLFEAQFLKCASPISIAGLAAAPTLCQPIT